MWLKIGMGLVGLYLILGLVGTLYYRHRYRIVCKRTSSKTICLTFDDGIDPVYTPRLLDTLKAHQVQGTFFVLGQSLVDNMSIVNRIKAEGHTLAYHSLRHTNQILQWPHQIKGEFSQGHKIFKAINHDLKYYRPPWGHMRLYGLYWCHKYRLRPVHWNLIVGDWKKNQSVDHLCHLIKSQMKATNVICLHDGRGKNHAPSRTIQALERLIGDFKEEGYTFENIDTFYKNS